jgi:hypothetical protein
MCFFLEGRTVSDGKHFKLDDEFWTIEAALEGARKRLKDGCAHLWITDHQQRLILSFKEVRDLLEGPSATATA